MATAKEALLIEIGTEELPPASLEQLAESFREILLEHLRQANLAGGEGRAFATPRRLAVMVSDVPVRQPDTVTVRRGPSVAVAFGRNDEPTKAALGFARSCGVEVDKLLQEDTDKGAWLMYRQEVRGAPALEVLPDLISQVLGDLPIARRMRWGSGSIAFVRPVHWVCGLLGGEVLKGQILGVDVGKTSRGHRFHHPEPVEIEHPRSYIDVLQRAYVEVGFGDRRHAIREQVTRLASECGGKAVIDEALLDEVTALCEWPTSVLCSFDEEFLEVPSEVLIETMQKNQKYFPVLDREGQLTARFVAVCNIESRAPEIVRAGNERVIRPRFADARFFWDQDQRVPLIDRLEELGSVVFEHRLGSVQAKSYRVAALGESIAADWGWDTGSVRRSALLSKCDLLTRMVGEFPSLQGTMGRCYALVAGEKPSVAQAIEEQYLPRHAGDRLPQSACGQVIALADRLDTLVGIFSVGARPTGDKDPYGLRRAAIGILRILVETPLSLDLRAVLRRAAGGYGDDINAEEALEDVLAFILERMHSYCAGRQIGGESVVAVLALNISDPSDIAQRIDAVEAFRKLPEANALATSNKRIRNILRRADAGDVGDGVVADVFEHESERALSARISELSRMVEPLLSQGRYTDTLRALAGLRRDIDRFFDDVMVLVEDRRLRRNRLAILTELERLFMRVADISLIGGSGGRDEMLRQ